MSILSPVDVERFNVHHKHPHYSAELQKRAIDEQWLIMVDGREIKNCIAFDKKNRFAKFHVTDSAGRIVLDGDDIRTAYAKGEVHVFSAKDAV